MATEPMVTKLLAEIESELLRAVPLAVQAAKVSEPVYAVILCYIDTTTNDYMPFVVVCPERVRQWAIERKGNDASWKIWSPVQELGSVTALPKRQYLQGEGLSFRIRACYKLL